MQVWRKGREFVRMLECKQQFLQSNILKTEDKLTQLCNQIAQSWQEFTDISHQIKMLTPIGVLNQADIYKSIRLQGVLLAQQQWVFHKISQLESEQCKLEHILEKYRFDMTQLDKKHYKLTCYLQLLHRGYLRYRDNAAENEIQELTGYGRKNF
ncbi:TPA: type III secretion system protein [Escherichia coli]|uniref:type III secretion system protein n=1 Tax=Escherichia coli TaxID=562 RepID=UPI000BE305CD|nr:type III secretion system protein [Escherichia coli]MBS9316440.1 type III secretion system protein [Escherichia coli]